MNTISWLILSICVVAALALLYWSDNIKRDDGQDKELYEKGFQHGLRGHQRDVDHREAYNDGYSDGARARMSSDVEVHQ